MQSIVGTFTEEPFGRVTCSCEGKLLPSFELPLKWFQTRAEEYSLLKYNYDLLVYIEN